MNALLRKVGFELEFSADTGHSTIDQAGRWLASQYGAGEVEAVGRYVTNSGDKWQVKTDSTCGYEIATPIINDFAGLIRASEGSTAAVVAAGGTVNDRCGLHIHVDMTSMDLETFQRIMAFFSRYESAFFLLADPWRRVNTYCKRLDDSIVNKVKRSTSDQWKTAWPSKHYWVNGTNLSTKGTLEFRLMAAKLSPEYITLWTLFLLHSIDYCIQGKKICWGQAKCASDRDLLQTMLGQAGFYGPWTPATESTLSRDKVTAVAARKWAVSTYTTFTGQADRRIKAPTIGQLATMVG